MFTLNLSSVINIIRQGSLLMQCSIFSQCLAKRGDRVHRENFQRITCIYGCFRGILLVCLYNNVNFTLMVLMHMCVCLSSSLPPPPISLTLSLGCVWGCCQKTTHRCAYLNCSLLGGGGGGQCSILELNCPIGVQNVYQGMSEQ